MGEIDPRWTALREKITGWICEQLGATVWVNTCSPNQRLDEVMESPLQVEVTGGVILWKGKDTPRSEWGTPC